VRSVVFVSVTGSPRVCWSRSRRYLRPVAPLRLRSALHWAALSCGLDVLRALLRLTQARLLNVEDSAGYTPLLVAAEFGRMETVEFLLRRNANPMLKSRLGLLPVAVADWYGSKKMVEAMEAVMTERWGYTAADRMATLNLGAGGSGVGGGGGAGGAGSSSSSSTGLAGVNPATAGLIAQLPR